MIINLNCKNRKVNILTINEIEKITAIRNIFLNIVVKTCEVYGRGIRLLAAINS